MKKFLVLIIVILTVYFLPSCKKEYSYEGGPTTNTTNDSSIFTLNGYPNTCSNTKVLGNYVAGVKLSSANTITLMVNVTKTGIYSITTELVNGMSFTTSGIFTKTGSQEVSLKGTGTPLSKAVNWILVDAGISNCSFAITVNEDTPVIFALNTWEFTHDTKTYRGYFDGALTNFVNGSTVLTLVGLTATKDTAIAILADIVGSTVVKPGTYKTLSTSSFTFFDNKGTGIYLADKTSTNVELSVIIANYDASTQIVSGTFSGTALNAANHSIAITNGKFRAKLNQ